VAAAAAGHTTVPARAAPECDCVRRHLANRNELRDVRVSGSDSYALLFLFIERLISEVAQWIVTNCENTFDSDHTFDSDPNL